MANELAVVEQAIATTVDKSPKATKTRAQLLSLLPGIVDDPTKVLSAVIKNHLKKNGMTNKQADTEYKRILAEDTRVSIIAKIEWAKENGYLFEYKNFKDTKDGQEKFAINFIPPKVAEQLTVSQQDKMFSLVGGRDSVMGKQLLEHLQKGGMLAKPKTVNVEGTVVSQS